MVIDCHTHLAHPGVIPSVFLDGIAENILGQVPQMQAVTRREYLSKVLGSMMQQDPAANTLLKEMNEAAIGKAVLLIIDFGIAFPDQAHNLKEIYELHRDLLRTYPDRFMVFAGIDPRRGKEGCDLFEDSVKNMGFRGLKLYPPCGYSPSDPALFPYYEIAQTYNVPVLLHTGPTSPVMPFSFSDPALIDGAACRFPKVKFILAHAAFMMHEQGAVMAEYRPNVFLDVSGFTNALRMDRFHSILSEHKKRGIIHKLLFGTDWPIHRLSGDQKFMTATFKNKASEVLTQEETDKIMYLNFNELSIA